MNTDRLVKTLVRHEGLRIIPYRCPAGRLTIGFGHNLDAGISEELAYKILDSDIDDAVSDLKIIFPGFHLMSDARQEALINMRFQLGPTGFRKFKQMIDAIRRGDFASAALEIKSSAYYRQVPERAEEIRIMMDTGMIDERIE